MHVCDFFLKILNLKRLKNILHVLTKKNRKYFFLYCIKTVNFQSISVHRFKYRIFVTKKHLDKRDGGGLSFTVNWFCNKAVMGLLERLMFIRLSENGNKSIGTTASLVHQKTFKNHGDYYAMCASKRVRISLLCT